MSSLAFLRLAWVRIWWLSSNARSACCAYYWHRPRF